MRFVDRADAGRKLAPHLEFLRGSDPIVLGLPRGGVPVAHEVAKYLSAPLDVILVRKLGAPGHPEYAFGAIGEGGVRVLDPSAVRMLGILAVDADAVEARERAELDRIARSFRADRPAASIEGRVAIIVDDGIATGATAKAACQVARARRAARVVVAAPVAPPDWQEGFHGLADDTVTADTPHPFLAVGQWYRDFSQTTESEVAALIDPQHPVR